MSFLQISNLTKSFPQGNEMKEVLHSISLNVERGEFIAVMGPSGSGKSTFLHLIAGLISPDSGDIVIDGVNISTLDDNELTKMRRRKIGFIFQSYNLLPSLTVRENIVLPVLADGKDVDSKELEQLLDVLEIGDKQHRYPLNLSGGEQQRVAIARALLQKPSLILADEPTGSLDSVSGQHFCKLLSDIRKKINCAIILVTHEKDIADWANHILILKDGIIQKDTFTQVCR